MASNKQDVEVVSASEDLGTTGMTLLTSENATASSGVQWNEQLAQIEVTVLCIIFVLTILGNSIVIIALWRFRRNFTRMHYFIVHLCLADLLVALFNILPQIIMDATRSFMAPDFICRFVMFGQVFPIYLSTYMLVMMSVDRYLAICYPMAALRGNNERRSRLMVMLAWSISFVFALPQLALFHLESTGHQNECNEKFKSDKGSLAYMLMVFSIVYLIPVIIIISCYVRITVTIWRNVIGLKGLKEKDCEEGGEKQEHRRPFIARTKHTTNLDTGSARLENSRRHNAGRSISRAKTKTVKMAVVIVALYIICWSPQFVCQLWFSLAPQNAPVNSEPFVIILLLASLNSCTNPWVYLSFSGNAISDLKKRLFIYLGLTNQKTNMQSKRIRTTTPSSTVPQTVSLSTIRLNNKKYDSLNKATNVETTTYE
ncbi:isotocin receptor-like [Anneissia japonica]|uniref:isotocin receptor-like n=1 Tax=Anneissia japonica TaxID=1529436 RepID=UPI0014254EAA|nr:isotocin receptor-like [Anneissia japonica]